MMHLLLSSWARKRRKEPYELWNLAGLKPRIWEDRMGNSYPLAPGMVCSSPSSSQMPGKQAIVTDWHDLLRLRRGGITFDERGSWVCSQKWKRRLVLSPGSVTTRRSYGLCIHRTCFLSWGSPWSSPPQVWLTRLRAWVTLLPHPAVVSEPPAHQGTTLS